MRNQTRVTAAVLGAALLASCTESTSPPRQAPPSTVPPSSFFAAVTAPGSGISLDQVNGTFNASGTTLIKGFNTTNPHNGDAVVATFFWVGSGPNLITSVTDVLTMSGFPVVGNTYTLVEYVSSGGISMATYVATNVHGFPDGYNNPMQDSILAVRATLSQPVTDGGLLISAWSGVDNVTNSVVAAHSSASGAGSTPTPANPGTVAVGAGGLAVGVTLSNGIVGADPPTGFTEFGVQSDASMVEHGDYQVSPIAGTVSPQWMWYFSQPSSWLASVLTLNPPPHLAFTQQPSTTLPLMTIQPAVRVTVLDALGNPATSYNGPVTIAIGHNGGLALPGTLSGTKTVNAVNGVATFADLSIDQPGNGYTLVVTAARVTGGESASFNISVL